MIAKLLAVLFCGIVGFSVAGSLVHYQVFSNSFVNAFAGAFIGWACYAIFSQLEDNRRAEYDL